MGRLSNETLSAYMDGQQEAEAAARVYLALPHDADARRRLESMRRAELALQDAFSWRGAGETELIARIAQGVATQPRRWRPPSKLAALAALAVVVVGGFSLHLLSPREVVADPKLDFVAGGRLATALDRRPSADLGPAGWAMTFRTRDGRICRRFLWEGSLDALACRTDERWRLVSISGQPGAAEASAGRVMDLLGVAEVLDPAKERRLIASAWTADH
jgi:hypothetical protein